jgi:deoxyribodipyrimidine photolyase-related protein
VANTLPHRSALPLSKSMATTPMRQLVIILGDQLDQQAPHFKDFDPAQDVVWMAEVAEESTHIPSSKQRIALFLSAMRHFAATLTAGGVRVLYTQLDDPQNCGTLQGELTRTIQVHRPKQVIMTAPGDWRVLQALKQAVQDQGMTLLIHEDTHFITTVREFAAYAKGRKQLRLEYFYRDIRKKTGLLMQSDQPETPEGGQWNFDQENRGAFAASGPADVPPPTRFKPDAITQSVIQEVNQRFADHPGRLDSFAWPVTRPDALIALEQFITQRLPGFGQYQDAMWQGEVWLYHSHLSAALNLKLLNPMEVARAAEAAYRKGLVPLAAAEGFIRQVIGWREYVRGIYWTQMPGYLELNALKADQALPDFYWTGNTEMACMKDAITQSLAHGYAHHIQRLMVTGLYALLYGVRPKEIHAWYLSMYVDAVEWVELPNTLGMSQFADGGIMASKPYAATGKYIQRMSNYCKGCRYDPSRSTGENACPFTTLYWAFLIRHEASLKKNPRMSLQVRNLDRLSTDERRVILQQADSHRTEVASRSAPL